MIKKINAKEIGVKPALIENYTGTIFFIEELFDTAGAQCSNCHNILWINSRKNKILTEKKPDSIPESGENYKNYHKNKILNFLNSLPNCPKCGKKHYSRFITNFNFPKSSNGEELNNYDWNTKVHYIDNENYLVDFYE